MAASGGEGDTAGAASLDLADLSFDMSGSGTEEGKVDLTGMITEAGTLNGPVENGFFEGLPVKPMNLGSEVVADTIEEAAAVIVECAMNGALNVTLENAGHSGAAAASGRRADNYMSPSTTDSGITMMTNGLGKDHIEMDASEPNDSTTTETSALSEVIDQIIDKSAEAIASERAAADEQLVDLSDIGITTASLDATGASVQDPDTGTKNDAPLLLDFSVDAGTGAAGDTAITDAKQEEKEKEEELDEEVAIQSIRTTQHDDEFEIDSPKKEAPKVDVPSDIPSITVDHGDDDKGFDISRLNPPAIQVIAASPSVEERAFMVENEGVNKSSTDEAQDAWAGVKEITPAISEDGATAAAKPVETTPLISYHEAYDHVNKSDLEQFMSEIKTAVPRRGLNKLKHLIFGPPKLHRDLHTQRDIIFCMAKAQLNNDDTVHTQILQTLYRKLTGSKFDCNRFGSHWEQIGFQGNDPATDLRGTGMLGLLQLLYMVSDPRLTPLARDIYKLSRSDEQNFPFCLMGINMSQICIQALREDFLNKECNRRKSVMEAMNEFFMGCYHHMYTIWKQQGKTIKDSGFVIKDVESYAKKNPVALMRALDTYLQKRKGVSTATGGPDTFRGIADLESDEEN